MSTGDKDDVIFMINRSETISEDNMKRRMKITGLNHGDKPEKEIRRLRKD